jgi:hypothetical protein
MALHTLPPAPDLPRVCIEGQPNGGWQLLLRMVRSGASVAALASAIQKYDVFGSKRARSSTHRGTDD